VLVIIAALSLVAAPHAAPPDGQLAAAALAVTFGWAAAAKVVARRRWARALATYALPPSLERMAVRAVPATEAVVPALVLLGLPRVAAMVALVLVVVFAIATVRTARRRHGMVACGCFGGRRERSLRAVLARDAGLAVCAVVATAWSVDAARWPWPPGLAVVTVTGWAAAHALREVRA
jgi:hypothetical protein